MRLSNSKVYNTIPIPTPIATAYAAGCTILSVTTKEINVTIYVFEHLILSFLFQPHETKFLKPVTNDRHYLNLVRQIPFKFDRLSFDFWP